MSRVRVSTTVSEDLLAKAREACLGLNDAKLLDKALEALLHQYRSAEIDSSYQLYDQTPISEVDEWGDLASFREAASSS